jgi:phosphoglycerol transferase MdoB-like AlkP superfamily enzyme
MKLGSIVKGWDLWCAVLAAVVMFLLLPRAADTSFAKDLYGVGINVLSVIFAVYFAALAIIMASPDNDFILFMEQTGDFSELVSSLQVTQWTLFVALIVSLLLYGWTADEVSAKVGVQSRRLLVLFGFVFFYALFSAAGAAHDAIQYSRYRTKFLEITKSRK